MNKVMVEYYIENLKKDIKILVDNKYHPRCHDLLNMVLLEDIPELIKFIEKVTKSLDVELPHPTGQFQKGEAEAINSIRREIYGE